jgi:ferritin-like metal-binding protein YciE
MPVRDLAYLFHEILKDVYYLETRLLRTLTKMVAGATSAELAAIFETRLGQTERHLQRLEAVFAILGERPEGRTWPAVDGIIEEGADFVEHYKSSPALDAGLLASAQAVAQYAMTRYTTLKRWAAMLGMQDAARLLDDTLLEETQSSQELHVLAERMATAKAPAKTMALNAAPEAKRLAEVA